MTSQLSNCNIMTKITLPASKGAMGDLAWVRVWAHDWCVWECADMSCEDFIGDFFSQQICVGARVTGLQFQSRIVILTDTAPSDGTFEIACTCLMAPDTCEGAIQPERVSNLLSKTVTDPLMQNHELYSTYSSLAGNIQECSCQACWSAPTCASNLMLISHSVWLLLLWPKPMFRRQGYCLQAHECSRYSIQSRAVCQLVILEACIWRWSMFQKTKFLTFPIAAMMFSVWFSDWRMNAFLYIYRKYIYRKYI